MEGITWEQVEDAAIAEVQRLVVLRKLRIKDRDIRIIPPGYEKAILSGKIKAPSITFMTTEVSSSSGYQNERIEEDDTVILVDVAAKSYRGLFKAARQSSTPTAYSMVRAVRDALSNTELGLAIQPLECQGVAFTLEREGVAMYTITYQYKTRGCYGD